MSQNTMHATQKVIHYLNGLIATSIGCCSFKIPNAKQRKTPQEIPVDAVKNEGNKERRRRNIVFTGKSYKGPFK